MVERGARLLDRRILEVFGPSNLTKPQRGAAQVAM
jgi:hypothetical protein